jgi:hypothetical protein
MLLLISGDSATGKSTFSEWLRDEHGYKRHASDEDPNFLEKALSAAGTSPNVVLDWAIPAGAISLATNVIAQGFEAWWFSGDRKTTREVFLARPDHPATFAMYVNYMNGVDKYWPMYESLFADRRLDVLLPGPWHMPVEERLERIQAYPRPVGN